MAKSLRPRRGSSAQHAVFVGDAGELTIDTSRHSVVVHDGVTPGGFDLKRELADGTGIVAGVSASRLSNTVIQVPHLKALPTTDLVDGQQYSVAGFYPGSNIGGGTFVYDASRSWADHNGGTVIAPPAIAAWDGTQADIASILNWTPTGGVGCWVRVDAAQSSIYSFGGVDGEDITLPLNAMFNAGIKEFNGYSKSFLVTTTTLNNIPDKFTFKKVSLALSGYANLADTAVFVDVNISKGGLNLSGGKSLFFRNLSFNDVDFSGINCSGGNTIIGFGLRGDNIGISPTMNPTFQGAVMFVLNALTNNTIIIEGFKASKTFGQGSLAVTRGRNIHVSNIVVDNIAYRAFSYFGDVQDGLGPLNNTITNATITRCGEARTGSSGVGSNAIYSQMFSGSTPSDPADLVVNGAVIKKVAENGIEGNGTWLNVQIADTGAYPSLATPSKEGCYFTGGTIVRNLSIKNASESGLVISPNADNIDINDVTIDGYGQHGIECNRFDSTSRTISNFRLKNINILSEPNDRIFKALFIKDTGSGVTTYGDKCYIDNVTVAGRQLYEKTESGATRIVSTDINPIIPIKQKYFKSSVVVGAPSVGTHYLGDQLTNCTGFNTGNVSNYLCNRSGTFEARSATGVSATSGNSFFDATASDLKIGDVVFISAGSDGANNTIKRWTILRIDGTRHTLDRSIFGTLSGATISTIAPTFSLLRG